MANPRATTLNHTALMQLYDVLFVILMGHGATDDDLCAALGSMSCHQPGALDRVTAEVDKFIKRIGDDEATRAHKREVIVDALRLAFCPEDFKDFPNVESKLRAKYMLEPDEITYDGIIDAYNYLKPRTSSRTSAFAGGE